MEPTDFNLRHLKAVIATAITGSVSAAAFEVNLTQPAITQAILKLERQIGLSLFERGPGGMAPTEAATILTSRAQRALELIGSPRVTAPQMRAFVALARRGSYVDAALDAGVREPSLHRAVADLSAGIGQKLVERRGRGVALTSRGLVLARRFRLAEAEIRAALAELEALKGRDVGRIVVGAMPLPRARLLPDALAAFHKAHPQVDVAIVEGSYAELVGPLRDGDIDVTLGAIREEAAGDLLQQPLFRDRPVILGRAGHPLLDQTSAPTPSKLASYEWVVPGQGTPLRAQWRQIFQHSGIDPPRVAIECGSVMVIRQLLMQGDFLTLLSPDQVAVELEAGWLARVGPVPGKPSRLVGLTTRAAWLPTRMQQRFLDLLCEQAKKIGSEQD